MPAAPINHAEMQCYLLGERAACMSSSAPVDLACQQRIWTMTSGLRQHAGIVDVVPGMNNLTVFFDPDICAGETIVSLMKERWAASQAQTFASRNINIPVRYGGASGPDLADVAAHTGLSEDEVIAAHSAADYVVYFMGFQPGFAYLGGLPECLVTPRRASPRTRVPAGSVGIGGAQTGIYPLSGPGGWQLIGHTDLRLFDPTSESPILLQPGDVVRFVPLDGDD